MCCWGAVGFREMWAKDDEGHGKEIVVKQTLGGAVEGILSRVNKTSVKIKRYSMFYCSSIHVHFLLVKIMVCKIFRTITIHVIYQHTWINLNSEFVYIYTYIYSLLSNYLIKSYYNTLAIN